jgi:hypothetical protein
MAQVAAHPVSVVMALALIHLGYLLLELVRTLAELITSAQAVAQVALLVLAQSQAVMAAVVLVLNQAQSMEPQAQLILVQVAAVAVQLSV